MKKINKKLANKQQALDSLYNLRLENIKRTVNNITIFGDCFIKKNLKIPQNEKQI